MVALHEESLTLLSEKLHHRSRTVQFSSASGRNPAAPRATLVGSDSTPSPKVETKACIIARVYSFPRLFLAFVLEFIMVQSLPD